MKQTKQINQSIQPIRHSKTWNIINGPLPKGIVEGRQKVIDLMS